MTPTVAAPGKLTLIGEYGVLQGGPVLMAAANRFARVALSPTGTPGISFASPAEGIETVQIQKKAPESRLGLATTVINSTLAYLASRGRKADNLHVHLDVSSFQDGGQSLGLGSSGASAVAIAGALFDQAGLAIDSPAARWDLLTLAAHAQSTARGPQASGSDVAAAVYGGVTVYRRGGEVRRVALPKGVCWAAIRSSGAISTGSMLFRLPGDSGAAQKRLLPLLDDLASSAQRCEDSLEDGASSFLPAAKSFCDSLDRLGQETGALTISPAMKKVITAVAEQEVVAKPTPTSGAADLGLLFAQRPEALAEAIQTCTELGFVELEIEEVDEGIRLLNQLET